jgi:hypothetical protein
VSRAAVRPSGGSPQESQSGRQSKRVEKFHDLCTLM